MKLIDEARDAKTFYEPDKYIMQDVGNIYIGAKYCYKELLENKDLNFKVRAIISQYILKESDPATTLESDLYYLKAGSFVYETLEQLRLKVKVVCLTEKRSLFGKTKKVFTEKIYPIKELVNIDAGEKERQSMVISELVISKLSLSGFTL